MGRIFDTMGFILGRMRHSATFVLVTLATLAVSLGAATTMFTVVNAFLLSSLPYHDADRLVMVWNSHRDVSVQAIDHTLPLSPGAFTDLRASGRSFERLAGFLPESVNVIERGEASRIHALFVSGDFFPLLGVRAAIGRALGPEDIRSDAPPVVAISHDLWQRHFGSDPRVLDRSLEFGGVVREVVGVLPADFRLSESLVAADPMLSKPVEIWAPFDPGASAHERGFHYLKTIGRLMPNVSLEEARGEMSLYAARAAEEYPDTDERYGMEVVSLRDQIFGHLRPVLLTLWAATLLILLIACVNLATLLSARMQRGRRETAVRLALGASRSRVVGESLVESVGLSFVGGLLSLGVAYVATRLLTVLNPVNVFDSYPPRIDLRVILVTLAASVVVGFLFGALPSIRAGRVDSTKGLGEGSARLTSRSNLGFSVLVASQVALATTLLIGMGLSFKTFRGLLRADLGANIEKVVTFDLFLPHSPYRDPALKVGFLRELLERTEALPGVESVGMSYALPFSGVDPSNGFDIVGRPLAEGENRSANLGFVNPDYFETLGIPLLAGRSFLESDTQDAPRVAIVDERLAERYFGGEDPLGRRISIASEEELTIVGVVGAVKQDALEDIARPYVYLPYQQRSYMFTTLAVKTSLEEPLSLARPVRDLVKELDPSVPVANPLTLEDAYRRALAPQRFSLLMMSVFAGISLFLTLVGTYGVMAFLVRQRRREAGIRMALGAKPKQIVGLILKHGFAVSLMGTAIGLGLAVAAGKIMANLTFGVETRDWMVFSVVPAIVLLATFIAYYPPARALSRVDPSDSLRVS